MTDCFSIRPRVLCLDGGGIRGLSEILILKELMLQVRLQNRLDYTPEPRQCFEFICGTSTGGLVAVMLGRLGKCLAECEEIFRDLGPGLFGGSSFVKTVRLGFRGSKHGEKRLEDILRSHAGEDVMHEADPATKGHIPVSVVAVSKVTAQPHLFRTYGPTARDEDCRISDACRATSAAIMFFPSITINGVEYVDGAFGNNNPSELALDDLESEEWSLPLANAVKDVGCLVSIGTGRKNPSPPKDTFFSRHQSTRLDEARLKVQLATDCERTHRGIQKRFTKAGRSDAYHRFNVDTGLASVKLDHGDEASLRQISDATLSYLERNGDYIPCCAMLLKPANQQVRNLSMARLGLLPDMQALTGNMASWYADRNWWAARFLQAEECR